MASTFCQIILRVDCDLTAKDKSTRLLIRCGYKGEGSLGIDSRNMVVIIFGVAGAGKTTIGQLLADELGWRFYEGDDFHSQANIEKMREGIPLTDEDRWPWLENLRELIKRCLAAGENAVLACSALKEAYRRRLRVNAESHDHNHAAWYCTIENSELLRSISNN